MFCTLNVDDEADVGYGLETEKTFCRELFTRRQQKETRLLTICFENSTKRPMSRKPKYT